MALKRKYQYKHEDFLRDVRPLRVKIVDGARETSMAVSLFTMAGASMYIDPRIAAVGDLILFFGILYTFFLVMTPTQLPFKLPKTSGLTDRNQVKPGGGFGKAGGIMYFGNDVDTGEEIWFTDSDARTHILYLGTTGSGKTEGLKVMATNALCWSSGFVFIDGKADTNLWSALSAISRRFGRDDDLLVMNYMTGGAGGRVPSNTLNPFSSGSASYLTNMLVSLMPDAEGDNAMWKDRAVALVSAMMPCLVWKRDHQNIPLSVGVIRRYLGYSDVIKLQRDKSVPEHLRAGLKGYLNELPGYMDSAYDDEGNEKPAGPDAPPFDASTPRQQHGYLSMQFTRSLQSLGDDYGFIFDTQAADVDMMDVVLQRRILVVLIPALEKSSDETANLGKIISSTLKGMMGATLGHTVEGDTATTIDNKPTNSATPFIAIFDEVGYYAAQGMAVMAAQARSLGFCLIFAGQDLPAMEKRVKEEARSITANCNIKLFGKLEDPTATKDFFEKTVGQVHVAETGSFQRQQGSGSGGFQDSNQANIQLRARASYDGLRGFNEGKAVCAFGKTVVEIQMMYANPGKPKAMRVQKMLPVPPPSEDVMNSLREVDAVLKRFRSKKWRAEAMGPIAQDTVLDVEALVSGYQTGLEKGRDIAESATFAVVSVAVQRGVITADMVRAEASARAAAQAPTAVTAPQAAPGSDAGGMSWMDFINDQPGAEPSDTMGGAAASPFAPAPAQQGGDDAGGIDWDALFASDTPAAQTDATGAAGFQPMSWEMIMGMADAAAAPAPARIAPMQDARDIDQSYTPPQTPPFLDAPMADPQDEAPTEDDGQFKPMSWSDIIGTED